MKLLQTEINFNLHCLFYYSIQRTQRMQDPGFASSHLKRIFFTSHKYQVFQGVWQTIIIMSLGCCNTEKMLAELMKNYLTFKFLTKKIFTYS